MVKQHTHRPVRLVRAMLAFTRRRLHALILDLGQLELQIQAMASLERLLQRDLMVEAAWLHAAGADSANTKPEDVVAHQARHDSLLRQIVELHIQKIPQLKQQRDAVAEEIR